MATLREVDGAWVMDWRENGKRKRTVLGRITQLNKSAAQALVDQKNAALKRRALPTNAPRFIDFVRDYDAWHRAEYPDSHERVAQILEDHLLPTFGQFFLDAIQPRDVEAWKQKRLQSTPKVATNTVIKELRTLKAVFNRALKWRVITENPIAGVEGPRVLDSKPVLFYTAEELRRLYDACREKVNGGEGPQPNPMHAHWWRLFVNTGMRRGEGVELRWNWVGKTSMKILSTEEARTKSGKWREIPLSPGAQEALEALPKDGQFVLPRITLPSLSRAFVRDATRAKLDGGLHTLRHTYISHLVMQRVPLRAVQQLAGHSSITVTEKYAHLAPDFLQQHGAALDL